MSKLKPSIGKIVLYRIQIAGPSENKKDYDRSRFNIMPAMITNVNENGSVDLCAFDTGCTVPGMGMQYSDDPVSQTWYWMPE